MTTVPNGMAIIVGTRDYKWVAVQTENELATLGQVALFMRSCSNFTMNGGHGLFQAVTYAGGLVAARCRVQTQRYWPQ